MHLFLAGKAQPRHQTRLNDLLGQIDGLNNELTVTTTKNKIEELTEINAELSDRKIELSQQLKHADETITTLTNTTATNAPNGNSNDQVGINTLQLQYKKDLEAKDDIIYKLQDELNDLKRDLRNDGVHLHCLNGLDDRID